jgi:hypothetical protein
VGQVFLLPTKFNGGQKRLPTLHFDLCITMSAGAWEREKNQDKSWTPSQNIFLENYTYNELRKNKLNAIFK